MLVPEPPKTYVPTVLAFPAGGQNQGQQAVPVQSHAPIMGPPGFRGEIRQEPNGLLTDTTV
jgi:hypothetical protein